jgi:hypothetical protein
LKALGEKPAIERAVGLAEGVIKLIKEKKESVMLFSLLN